MSNHGDDIDDTLELSFSLENEMTTLTAGYKKISDALKIISDDHQNLYPNPSLLGESSPEYTSAQAQITWKRNITETVGQVVDVLKKSKRV